MYTVSLCRVLRRLLASLAFLTLISPFAHALTLSGTVLGPDSKPVSEASVWIGQGWEIKTTKTDAKGVFAFDRAETGAISVVVRKEGYALGGCEPFLTEDLKVDIVLLPAQTLTLRIVNGELVPVPGARVRFIWVSEQFCVPVDDLTEHGFPMLRSGDDGILKIPGLPEKGYVKLVMSHAKYAESVIPYLSVTSKRQDIILYPGIAVRGRVTIEGKGLKGALVSIFRPGVGKDQAGAETLTDTDGMYQFRVPQGDHFLNVRHPEYASPPAKPLTADPAQEEYTVDLEVVPPKIIRGAVVWPDNKPCVAVPVVFRTKEGILADTITASDGKFRLNVAQDKGTINIVPPPGFMTESLPDVHVDLGGQDHAELTPIRLKELPEIKGSVVFEDGKPAAKVLIASQNLEIPSWAITDEQGRFRFRLSFMPESKRATFRAEHALRLVRQDFIADLEQNQDSAITLKPFEPDQAQRPPTPGRNNLTPLLDKPAPEMKCSEWINSQPLTLESLKGRVVVMTFWGGFDESAFGVSRMEELRALFDLYQGVEDVVFLGVHDASNDMDEIEDYVQRAGLRFPIGRDADPFVTFINYNVNFIPQTVLIDKEGVLRYFEIDGRIPELIKVLRRAR